MGGFDFSIFVDFDGFNDFFIFSFVDNGFFVKWSVKC